VSTAFERRFSVKTAVDEFLPKASVGEPVDAEERFRERVAAYLEEHEAPEVGRAGDTADPTRTFRVALELAEPVDDYRREAVSPTPPSAWIVNPRPESVAAGLVHVGALLETGNDLGGFVGTGTYTVFSQDFFIERDSTPDVGWHSLRRKAVAAVWAYVDHDDYDSFDVDGVALSMADLEAWIQRNPPEDVPNPLS